MRNDDTGHASGERQQETLHQKLPDQTTRARAEGRASHDLVRARRGAREEQVCHVCACRREHQSDRPEEQPQRLVDSPEHIVGERHELHAKRPVWPGRRDVQSLFDRLELGGGRANRHTRL